MDAWFSLQIAQCFSLFAFRSLLACMAKWIKQGRHRNIVMGSYWASCSVSDPSSST